MEADRKGSTFQSTCMILLAQLWECMLCHMRSETLSAHIKFSSEARFNRESGIILLTLFLEERKSSSGCQT